MGYLDYTGLSHFKDKLETIFAPIIHSHNAATTSSAGFMSANDKTKLDNQKIFFGTCDTAAATAVKAVACSNFTSADLVAGTIVFVTFSITNSAAVANLKMNVNNTGEYPLKDFRNAGVSNLPGVGYLVAGKTYMFSFDGTNWYATMDYDSNDVSTSRLTYPRVKTGAVGIGRYTLFMEASDGTYQSITSTFNSTGTTHVKNPTKFRLGKIFYSDRSSDIAANNSSDTTNYWLKQQHDLVDLRYSTNCGQTLTAREPIFIVGTVDTDGYFTLDDTWWTQTIPSSEDGKVYIYLGQVYNDTNPYRVAFMIENPIYSYKDGGFTLYNGKKGITSVTTTTGSAVTGVGANGTATALTGVKASTTDTFVKSYPGASSKLTTTSVGSASGWSAGSHSATIQSNVVTGAAISGGVLTLSTGTQSHSYTAPALTVTSTTVATGAVGANSSGASVLTGLGTATTASAVTGVAANGTATVLTGVKATTTDTFVKTVTAS